MGLAEAGDPAKAPGMRAYMKSTMPYRGVMTTPRRRLGAMVVDLDPFTDRADWEATVDTLWDGATHREERYAAVDLAGCFSNVRPGCRRRLGWSPRTPRWTPPSTAPCQD